MILLFTDYGVSGPYLGQVMTVLQTVAPQVPVINLMADAPRNNPKASAYLLASLIHHVPEHAIVFAVVDPGVGTDTDRPMACKVDSRWFVGPDNGLFDLVLRDAGEIEYWEIDWQQRNSSVSFHGRDIYAPVCAMIATGNSFPAERADWTDRGWPQNLDEIIYIDHFGNAMTGIRFATLDKEARYIINGMTINYAPTFAAVKPGQAFWYGNSNGLIEFAVNQGSASQLLKLQVGSRFNSA